MVVTRAACCRWPWTILNYYGSLFERRRAEVARRRVPLPLPLKVINVVSSASRALPLLAQSGHIAASHRSATKSADARRGAALGGEPNAGATARVAADKRGVTRSQPQIHDSPRNQLNYRNIRDGEARSSRQRE